MVVVVVTVVVVVGGKVVVVKVVVDMVVVVFSPTMPPPSESGFLSSERKWSQLLDNYFRWVMNDDVMAMVESESVLSHKSGKKTRQNNKKQPPPARKRAKIIWSFSRTDVTIRGAQLSQIRSSPSKTSIQGLSVLNLQLTPFFIFCKIKQKG